MAKKIFFGNYKGGVGKTTSTFQIALELYEKHGASVLLLDLDPQSSLSGVCMARLNNKNNCEKKLDDEIQLQYKDKYGVERPKRKLSFKTLNYIYALYMQAKRMNNIKFTLKPDEIIQSIEKKPSQTKEKDIKFDFIPNSLFSEYGGLDKISIEVGKSVENLLILRDFIEDNELNDKYDYIFFDCPPSNNIITQSAFLYCDYYIIPTIMDELSVKGVAHYISVIEGIYDEYCVNHDHADVLSLLFGNKPRLIGIFETMRKARTDTTEAQTQLKTVFQKEENEYQAFIFESEIKDINAIAGETGKGNKFTGDGHSDWIKSGDKVGYGPVTKEMLERLKNLE